MKTLKPAIITSDIKLSLARRMTSRNKNLSHIGKCTEVPELFKSDFNLKFSILSTWNSFLKTGLN